MVFLGILGFAADLLIIPFLEGKFFNKIAIPELRDLDSAAACSQLTGKGLAVGDIHRGFSMSARSGAVMYQTPFAGQIVKKGRRVSFVLSAGQEMATVPNLRELSPSQASDTLQRLGLRLGETKEVYSQRWTPGSIIHSNPAAGDSVPRGSVVDITISQNSITGKTYVPDFVNLSLEQTREMARKYELALRRTSYRTESELVPGTVLEQSIKAGSKVDKGTFIDLVVSQ